MKFISLITFYVPVFVIQAQSEILTICFLWEEDSYFSTLPRSAAAVYYGVENANAFTLPKSIQFRAEYINTGPSCGRTMYSAVSKMYDLMTHGTKCNAFLGPSCAFTAAALYGFAETLNIPIFGAPAAGVWSIQVDANFSDYALLTRPAFGFSDLTDFLVHFLDEFHYIHVTVLQDDSYSYFSSMVSPIMSLLQMRRRVIFQNSVVTYVRSRNMTIGSYMPILRAANARSRVIFLMMHAHGIRDVMIAASKLGYTKGEHVYLAVQLYDLDYWGTITPFRQDANDSVAEEAYKSLLVVQLEEGNEDVAYTQKFERQLKTIARQTFNYTGYDPIEAIDPVVKSLYEAVIMYAGAIVDLKDKGKDYTDGYVLSDYLLGRSTIPPQILNSLDFGLIHELWIGVDGERDRIMNIQYYNPDIDKFEGFLQYNEHGFNKSAKFKYIQSVVWPSADGQLPPDEPVCGFRGDKCANSMSTATLTVAVTIPILLVLTIVIGSLFFVFKLRALRAQYDPLWWRILEDEVVFGTNGAVSGSRVINHSSTNVSNTSKRTVVPYSVGLSASVDGKLLNLKDVSDVAKYPKSDLIEELNTIKTIDHPNLHHFIGIVVRNDGICHYTAGEMCRKGTLADVLEYELIKLDWFFKNSIIRDLISGMAHLHTTPFLSHGFLSSPTCLIDSRFTLKVTDYGISYFRKPSDFVPPRPGIDNTPLQMYLWRAPELLRHAMPMRGTQKGDVYSFAIILQQIILRSPPFHLPNDPLELSDAEILHEIIANNIPPVRPRVPRSGCSSELYELMERCWDETPVVRPTFAKIRDNMKKVVGNVGDNIVDVLLRRMEQYADDLEQKVAEQTQQFLDEKNRSEELLNQLLPKFIATQLMKGIHADPEAFECVTIFFSDIVGFTTIAAKGTPMDVVVLLNSLYTFFDSVLEKFDVYKVETIGDAYMVSSGLPIRNGNRHAAEIAEMSLELVSRITAFVVPHLPQDRIQIRVGVNSGPCVAGIVGLKMPRYCLFGDTVNVTSRMESTGEPMKIQITEETRTLLEGLGGFFMAERGNVSVKGKGTMITHWLISKAKT